MRVSSEQFLHPSHPQEIQRAIGKGQLHSLCCCCGLGQNCCVHYWRAYELETRPCEDSPFLYCESYPPAQLAAAHASESNRTYLPVEGPAESAAGALMQLHQSWSARHGVRVLVISEGPMPVQDLKPILQITSAGEKNQPWTGSRRPLRMQMSLSGTWTMNRQRRTRYVRTQRG